MQTETLESPEIGVLELGVTAAAVCEFHASPARSVHAALLRRLELVNPALSAAFHDTQVGAPRSEHPWTISPLLGPLKRVAGTLITMPGAEYRVRVTALTPELLEALIAAFDFEHPLGRQPLHLENVAFHVAPARTQWRHFTTYAAILSSARPQVRISLEFLSPVGFRTREADSALPSPRHCVEGYLRKWNAFSSIAFQEKPILEYVRRHLAMTGGNLNSANVWMGRYAERGVRGTVHWSADPVPSALLRFVNALTDYAEYCGTGMKTAMGMGQTRRIGRSR